MSPMTLAVSGSTRGNVPAPAGGASPPRNELILGVSVMVHLTLLGSVRSRQSALWSSRAQAIATDLRSAQARCLTAISV
jgi:hypothetical protein